MRGKKRYALLLVLVVFTILGIVLCVVGSGKAASQELPQEPSQEEYMFIWMSDTQFYSGYLPEVYYTMTEWIAKNAEEKGIKFVFHTGDIVDHVDSEEEWQCADKAMRELEGVVPYSILAGNHDLFEEGDMYAEYLQYFGMDRFAGQDNIIWYGEGEASAQILEAGSQRYLVLALGFNPDWDAVSWADQILSQYRDIPAILTTHNYLRADGTLSSTGEELYREIVLKNPNVHLVLCGHNHNAEKNIAQIDDDGDGVMDRVVYQLLADYQETPDGGSGYMRLLTVNEEKKTMQVTTYSPFLDAYHCFGTSEYPGKDEFCIDISDWF